jgi:hypothetical protein
VHRDLEVVRSRLALATTTSRNLLHGQPQEVRSSSSTTATIPKATFDKAAKLCVATTQSVIATTRASGNTNPESEWDDIPITAVE